MKVGDLIKFRGTFNKERTGILVSEAKNSWSGWWNILDSDGKMRRWPTTEIEVISESR
tara:strand:- start:235 stop:408 length:174 start_codon:yes stop_codon:yes gene_type:complete